MFVLRQGACSLAGLITAEDALEFLILLPPFPQFWDYEEWASLTDLAPPTPSPTPFLLLLLFWGSSDCLGVHCVHQASLEIISICLPLPPKCWITGVKHQPAGLSLSETQSCVAWAAFQFEIFLPPRCWRHILGIVPGFYSSVMVIDSSSSLWVVCNSLIVIPIPLPHSHFSYN